MWKWPVFELEEDCIIQAIVKEWDVTAQTQPQFPTDHSVGAVCQLKIVPTTHDAPLMSGNGCVSANHRHSGCHWWPNAFRVFLPLLPPPALHVCTMKGQRGQHWLSFQAFNSAGEQEGGLEGGIQTEHSDQNRAMKFKLQRCELDFFFYLFKLKFEGRRVERG